MNCSGFKRLQAGGVAGLAEQNNRISVLLLLQSVAVSGSSRFSNCFSFALQRNFLYKRKALGMKSSCQTLTEVDFLSCCCSTATSANVSISDSYNTRFLLLRQRKCYGATPCYGFNQCVMVLCCQPVFGVKSCQICVGQEGLLVKQV